MASLQPVTQTDLSWVQQQFCAQKRIPGKISTMPRHPQVMRAGAKHICAAANFELAQVLTFSAFPFLAVTALANSGAGRWLSGNLEKRRETLQAEALTVEVERERARMDSSWYGEKRPKFFGSIPYPYPSYLDGTRAGDFGFDPLGFAKKPEAMERLYNLEILHARWAMLGALGAVVPELLQRYSGIQFLDPVWWSVGQAKLQGDDLDYLGIPGLHIAGGQGIAIIAIAQVFLMLGPEYARYTGIKALEPLGVYLPGDINYPGGWLFDPLGISKNARRFEDLKVREMKNGRLAMLAWVGFAVQAFVTRRGLLENWDSFLSDPEKSNALSLLIGDLRDYPNYIALKQNATVAIQSIQGSSQYRQVQDLAITVVKQVLTSHQWQQLQDAVARVASEAQGVAAELSATVGDSLF